MRKEEFLEILGEIDEKHLKEAKEYRKSRKPILYKWAAMAACVMFLISACFVSLAVVVEAKEYEAAIRFFDDYDISTEGLTREEIKAVYRDITTKSFSYSKTAEVIRNSISSDQIGGYEILQKNPTPEDLEKLWNYKNNPYGFYESAQSGVSYRYRAEYKEDPTLGFHIHDKSYIEKYDGEDLVWSVSVSEFRIDGYSVVKDGIIAYGENSIWSTAQPVYAWMVKIDTQGRIVWKRMLEHGFENESFSAILENDDGSYTVFSLGEWKYFCLSKYTAEGKETYFKKTEMGKYGIWNAARFGDGYIVQLGSYMTGEHAKIAKVDAEGNITESFSYGDADSYYYITDMTEFRGNIYLSAYAVPKIDGKDQSAGGEIAAIVNDLFENDIWEISDEELTPMVRENYTAILLVCEPSGGEPQEFYSVKGSLGGKLSVSEKGELVWDVESITSTTYSPYTSAFTIAGVSYIFRYTFDDNGILIGREDTGEIVSYLR